MPFETISVIGLGYIGLPTAAVFASRKIRVIGVDVNQIAVDTINGGGIHIVEPDLDAVVRTAVDDGYLRAVTKPEPADAFLIAVPTPFKKGVEDDHEPDLAYIESASKSIAPVLKKGDLVILESTSPVGATEKMTAWLAEERSDLTFPHTHGVESDIRVAYCPERVLPGQILRELVQNDRVVGGMTPKCAREAVTLYEIIVEGDCITTDARTAEMCKLTENSFRDVNIAFANELSIICDKLDINVWELIKLANRHPRVNILQPGPGVGGHCIAVDPWFIVSKTPAEARLICMAREVNDHKPKWVVKKILEAIERFLNENPLKVVGEVTVSIYGLTFKPNVDDLRQSPALSIAEDLNSSHSGPLLFVEPNIKNMPVGLQEKGRLVSFDEAKRANVHIMLVDHDAFKTEVPSAGIVVDFRGIWG